MHAAATAGRSHLLQANLPRPTVIINFFNFCLQPVAQWPKRIVAPFQLQYKHLIANNDIALVHIFKIMLQGQIIFSQSRRKPEWTVSVC